ncbi:MAG: hypothetical protein H6Q34_931 [Deltaproteobacteria bacterium]|nr:hypothetical protein [Deltaproteobacteria bacterium]
MVKLTVCRARMVWGRRRVRPSCRAWVGRARLKGSGALPAETDLGGVPHTVRASRGWHCEVIHYPLATLR